MYTCYIYVTYSLENSIFFSIVASNLVAFHANDYIQIIRINNVHDAGHFQIQIYRWTGVDFFPEYCHWKLTLKIAKVSPNTVDGRNPAPPNMYDTL